MYASAWTRCDRIVSLQRLGLVAARCPRGRARRPPRAGRRRSCTRSRREPARTPALAGLDQLVAGRQDDHPRAGMGERAAGTRRREQPELRRPRPPPGGHQHLAGPHVLAGRADVPPSGNACRTRTRSPAASAYSIGTMQSAPAGTGAPVAIRTASPPPTVASGRRPIRRQPDDPQLDRRPRPWRRDVVRPDREAVHRRGRERGEIARGDHVGGQRRSRTPPAAGARSARAAGLAAGLRPRLLDRERRSTVVVVVDGTRLRPCPAVYPWRRRGPPARSSARTLLVAAPGRRGTRGTPRPVLAVERRARPSPSGSRACCRCRTARRRTRTRTRPVPGQQVQGVGQLDLAPASGSSLAERVEDLGRQDVPADHRQVRRAPRRRRLLDDRDDPREASSTNSGWIAAVQRDLVAGDLHAPRSRSGRSARATRSICCSSGCTRRMMSSPSRTANGSPPTCVLGHRHRVAEAERVAAGGCSGSCAISQISGAPSARRTCPSGRGGTRARTTGRSGSRSCACPGR